MLIPRYCPKMPVPNHFYTHYNFGADGRIKRFRRLEDVLDAWLAKFVADIGVGRFRRPNIIGEESVVSVN